MKINGLYIALLLCLAQPSLAQDLTQAAPQGMVLEAPQAVVEQPTEAVIAPQAEGPEDQAPQEAVQAAAPASQAQSPIEENGFDAGEYSSLLFTFWERTAIQDARASRGVVRAPTDAELMRDLKKRDDEPKRKPPPEERDITLGGIVYKTSKNWTIWLNGKRVSPNALPKEVLDLRVFEEYVEIKWFDEYTNQIFPIRLRAHQRFNIDTRIFLPG